MIGILAGPVNIKEQELAAPLPWLSGRQPRMPRVQVEEEEEVVFTKYVSNVSPLRDAPVTVKADSFVRPPALFTESEM